MPPDGMMVPATSGQDDLADGIEDGLGTSGDPIVDEARREFQRCVEWEANARDRFIEDLKFRHGDADNGYQWPNAVRRSRDVDSKPCLTLNIIRQHNLMITNEMRKNKSEIRIIGTGNGATAEAAEAIDQLVKQIQWSSQAQNAYTLARAFQVDGGIGYWRIRTDWVEGTFEQQILLEGVPDPLTVYLDPDIQTVDGRDAKFAFVFDMMTRRQFRRMYPKFRDLVGLQPMMNMGPSDDWVSKDHVRVAEYFRVVEVPDELLGFVDFTTGVRKTLRASEAPANLVQKLKALPDTQVREIRTRKVEWYLIAADKVIEKTIWPGQFIPIIRLPGEEIVIEGILDRKGHTRAMKDAQRMYNYNASGQVEHVALQSKVPWTAAAAALEEHEGMWNNANNQNYSVLVFNHLDDEGNPIPPQALPQRAQPPSQSPAFEAGMATAFNQIMMVSGQWQNQMGMLGNERTGAAIQERQNQGDTATYHFRDNFEAALQFTGEQIVDLIPKIYDTKRVMILQDPAGEDFELLIDPGAARAFQVKQDATGKVVERVLNTQVGKYAVRALPGNAFGSQREQTVQALKLLLTQAPGLTGIIGDLLLRAMDFKEAQEAAQRLRRMVPPQALGEGPSQAEQMAQQQIVQLRAALAEALQKLGKEQLKLKGKDEMRDIDVYKAETDRFKALADTLMLDQGGIQQVIEQLIQEAAQTHLTPILEANAQGVREQGGGATDNTESSTESGSGTGTAGTPPMPGARIAPDGEWYLSDPTRRGRYLKIAPLAQEHAPRGVIANA